jgi:hypothetical protein
VGDGTPEPVPPMSTFDTPIGSDNASNSAVSSALPCVPTAVQEHPKPILEVHARMKPCIPGKASSFTSPPLSSACSSRSASNRPSSTSTIGTRLRNWRNRFTTSSKATREPTQQISGDNPRQRNKKERPCVGPFGAPSVPINRPLGGGCEQLPIPRHDHRVDDVDDAVRCSDITLPDVRSINLHVRRGHHYRQRTTLNGHHVT